VRRIDVRIVADPSLVGLAFLFFLEAATILTNEYFDHSMDIENTFADPFTGGSRVLVDGELRFDALQSGIRNTLLIAGLFGVVVLLIGEGAILPTAAVIRRDVLSEPCACRIDRLMIVSLSYLVWFSVVPLLELL